jgi:hypothetical protein
MDLNEPAKNIITATLQTPVTMTYQLVEATYHTTVTVTVTVARTMTMTSLVVVQGGSSPPGSAAQTG